MSEELLKAIRDDYFPNGEIESDDYTWYLHTKIVRLYPEKLRILTSYRDLGEIYAEAGGALVVAFAK